MPIEHTNLDYSKNLGTLISWFFFGKDILVLVFIIALFSHNHAKDSTSSGKRTKTPIIVDQITHAGML